jgi:hypothetical protein
MKKIVLLNVAISDGSVDVRHIGREFFSNIKVFCLTGFLNCRKSMRKFLVSKSFMDFECVFSLLIFSEQFSSKEFTLFQFSLLFICCPSFGQKNLEILVILASSFIKIFTRLVSFIVMLRSLRNSNLGKPCAKHIVYTLYVKWLRFLLMSAILPFYRGVLFFRSKLLFELDPFLLQVQDPLLKIAITCSAA